MRSRHLRLWKVLAGPTATWQADGHRAVCRSRRSTADLTLIRGCLAIRAEEYRPLLNRQLCRLQRDRVGTDHQLKDAGFYRLFHGPIVA